MPVIPVAMIDTEKIQPIGTKVPRIMKVGIKVGAPLDFSRYEGLENDRFVLRSMADEIMYELMELSGQEYVDMYAAQARRPTSPPPGRGRRGQGPGGGLVLSPALGALDGDPPASVTLVVGGARGESGRPRARWRRAPPARTTRLCPGPPGMPPPDRWSQDLRPHDGHLQLVGLDLAQEVVGRRAAVDGQPGQLDPGLVGHDVHHVAHLVGDRLERGPDEMGPGGASGVMPRMVPRACGSQSGRPGPSARARTRRRRCRAR